MSDISFDLSGLIAVLILIFSAAAFCLAGMVSLIIALASGYGTERGVPGTRAFAFFLAAMPFIVLNLIAFVCVSRFVDSNSHHTNDLLDTSACGWALLQPIIWIAAALTYNRMRLKSVGP